MAKVLQIEGKNVGRGTSYNAPVKKKVGAEKLQ